VKVGESFLTTYAGSSHRPTVESMKQARKSLGDTMLVATVLCSIVFPRVFCVGVVVIALIHILAN